MATLVQNIGDFFKVILQAFNLSTTFPALLFVGLLQFLPERSITRLDSIPDSWARFFVLMAAVGLIAYLLDAMNIVLIRSFEGYWLKEWLPNNKLQKWNENYVIEARNSVRQYEELANRLLDRLEHGGPADLEPIAEEAITRKMQMLRQVSPLYPDDPKFVLPTPFGNVVAASEQYPKKVFGMDAIVLWPFLIPTLNEKNYTQFLLREKTIMDFLVNLTTVMALFGVALLIAEWSALGWTALLSVKLIVIAICCWFFFALSIQAALSWGTVVRAAFVLYREELRKALRLRHVSTYKEEVHLWEVASNFLRARSTLDHQMAWGQSIFDSSSYATSTVEKEEK